MQGRRKAACRHASHVSLRCTKCHTTRHYLLSHSVSEAARIQGTVCSGGQGVIRRTLKQACKKIYDSHRFRATHHGTRCMLYVFLSKPNASCDLELHQCDVLPHAPVHALRLHGGCGGGGGGGVSFLSSIVFLKHLAVAASDAPVWSSVTKCGPAENLMSHVE
mmetsp:Transcript_33631/g.76139  ORF Transcript_33631/g.76139 Transcript_33631/m.76139 type:complete len:163 (+) Transcript_33631:53-541(+)